MNVPLGRRVVLAIPDVFVSVTYGVVAVIVAIVISRANPFELGSRFGVVRE